MHLRLQFFEVGPQKVRPLVEYRTANIHPELRDLEFAGSHGDSGTHNADGARVRKGPDFFK